MAAALDAHEAAQGHMPACMAAYGNMGAPRVSPLRRSQPMITKFVCAVRWAEVTIDVFRGGISTFAGAPLGKAVFYGGALRGAFETRAQPPEARGAWFRSVKQVVAHFGIADGPRIDWAPHEEPDAECSACGWRFWSGTGHATLAICRDCLDRSSGR